MKEKTMKICESINLKTVMFGEQGICPGQCYRGSLSINDEGQYLFEEAVPIDRHGHRNPKLFQGEYISLVHMQNGRWQMHCKTLSNASKIMDREEFASLVYNEILEAFAIIDLALEEEKPTLNPEP